MNVPNNGAVRETAHWSKLKKKIVRCKKKKRRKIMRVLKEINFDEEKTGK